MLDNWLVQGIIQNTVWALLVIAGGLAVAWLRTRSQTYANAVLYGLAAAVLTIFLLVEGKTLISMNTTPQQIDNQVPPPLPEVQGSPVKSGQSASIQITGIGLPKQRVSLFEAGKPAALNVGVRNPGPGYAFDVDWDAKIILQHAPVTDSIEAAMWKDFREDKREKNPRTCHLMTLCTIRRQPKS